MRHPLWLAALTAALSPLPANALSVGHLVTLDPVAPTPADPAAPLLRLTFPASGDHLPVVILSHGNRLSRTDYQPLVSALARAGYLVVQPDHPDASIDGFTPATPQPENTWRTRIEQLAWVARHLTSLTRAIPLLRGRVDASRIAIVGHSFGGHTAALAMGARVRDTGANPALPSIRAAVLLAPPGDHDGLTPEWKARAPYLRVDWSGLHGPLLIINGDKDDTPLTDRGPQWHDAPYRLAPAGRDICLMTVPGVGHYLGGIDSPLRGPTGDATPERRTAVFSAILSFLAAKLRPTPASQKDWIDRRETLDCK
ncbi:hypothetical protein LWE61_07855 [Sphingobium sufflavum]|uniref:alpha/beta hydrolase family protein n=1 Tax=Sphingobium sufflavum TaxID=1129547 RepID=UPI001F2EDA68|nr:hypothetical protein [Sphingobium sufflavum]MCE7796475.1 hypothetical protein [Sphingobium sufflavum]